MALLTNVMGSGTLCVLLLICSSLYAAEATTTASTPTQTNPTTPTPEKQYNEPCDPSVTNECAQGFECLNSTSEDLCECPSHQYYNESLCEERKQHKETCDSNTPNECAQGFECLSLSNPPGFLCECPSHQYYKESLCVEKLQFNETCRPDGECAENLQCDNETGTCFCLPSLYYNGSSCVERIGYNQGCTTVDSCAEDLKCIDFFCKCQDTQYHSGSNKCLPKKGYDEQCTSGSPGSENKCAGKLTCDVNSRCKCSSGQYHTGSSQCAPKISYNGTCQLGPENQCAEQLTCDANSRCKCSSGQYHSGFDQCTPKTGYDGQCTSVFQGSENQCAGQLTCVNFACKCFSGLYHTGSNQCAPKSDYDGYCTSGSPESENPCDGQLTCVTSRCKCSSGLYHTGGNQCAPKISYNEQCTSGSPGSENQCAGDLSCVNFACKCSDMEYHYGNDRCATKKGYDEQCSSVSQVSENQCAGQLTCDANSRCKCSSGLYHTGSNQCAPKIGYDGQCRFVYENPCAGQLTCDVTSRCKCFSGQYHSGNNLCAPRLAHGAGCANLEDPCQSGLSCVLNYNNFAPKCLCDPIGNSYWNGSSCQSVDWFTASERVSTRGPNLINFIWTVTPEGFVNNYQVVTQSSLQSCLQVQDSKSEPGSSIGVSFTGLRAGVKYLSTLTLVLTATTDYPPRSKVVSLSEAWTKPAQPGEVIPGSSTLSVPRTVLKFGPSDGCVTSYSVTVTGRGSQSVITDTAVFENLVADTFYSYTITAYNGVNDASASTSGSFTTAAAAPGSVDALSYQQSSVTATGVVVSWRRPSQPNGDLKGYKVWVTAGGQCIKQFHVQCPNCNFSECQPPMPSSPVSQYDSTDLGDFQVVFEVTVTDLLPYTDYIVHVRAYNREVGGGADSEVPFKTSEAAASPVTNVELESLPLTAQGRLDLNVSWVPGYRNGETTFTVVIKEKESLTSGNFTEKQTRTFEDTSGITSDILENVLGHWVYEVTVEAKTNMGVAAVSRPQTITTLYKPPGPVTALTLTKSTQVASDVSLSFGCPKEKERNGVITGFYISKSDRARDPVVQFVTATSCDSVFRPSVQVVVGESPTNYTFKVMASNGQYNSSYVMSEIVIRPLFPEVSEYTATDFTAESSASKNTLTSFPVTVCLSCLKDLNTRQGSLTKVVLAVCKNKCGGSGAGRRKRAVDVDSLKTWAKAKKEGFTGMYRATPRGWHQDLLRTPGGQYVFTVGEDNSCSDTGTDFCNGPLPAGQQYQVLVIVCNGAGCQDYLNDDSVFKTQVEEDDDDIIIIVVAVVCSLLVIALILGAVFFVHRRRKQKGKKYKETRPAQPDALEETEMIKRRRPIKMREFKETLDQLHKDSNMLFQAEFEDIKKLGARVPHTEEEAQREGNRVKNRYVDILPYDHSRVKLNVLPEEDDTMDFINANYIEGYNSVREYIAAQGPMPSTVPDFWRMVWEQKCKVIVMLSDLTEGGKQKVTMYWPENLNESIQYEDVVVEMTNFSQLNKYIIRNFRISMGSDSHKVTHFFLPGWSDFKANLTVQDVLEFTRIVRQEATPANSGPIVVHCSAGVGRTGTFIALDYFTQYVDKHSLDDNVDVFSFVMKMRENRPRMVQAETQYIFVFDALMEVIQKKIDEEQERLYDNVGRKAQLREEKEENIYANAPPQEGTEYVNNAEIAKFAYDNTAFEAEYQNVEVINDQKETPMTVL